MNRKALFLTLALLAVAVCASAQAEFVKQMAGVVGHESLVRYWKNNLSVAFAPSQPNGNSTFILLEDSNPTALIAEVPADFCALDFEILRDTLYFCGVYHSNPTQDYGIVGFFDINHVFYSAGDINYCIPLFTYTPPPYALQVTKLWRMDLYTFDNQVHIAAVGQSELQYPDNGTRTTIVDAYCNVGTWHLNTFYDRDGNEYYTDITATEHYVVAAGRRHDWYGDAACVRIYDQSPGFLGSPLHPNSIISIRDSQAVGKVLVEALEQDTFALTHYYISSNDAGQTLQRFHITNSAPYANLMDSYYVSRNTSPSIPSSWNLRKATTFQTVGHAGDNILVWHNRPVATSLSCLPLDIESFYKNIDNVIVSTAYAHELFAGSTPYSGTYSPEISLINIKTICFN